MDRKIVKQIILEKLQKAGIKGVEIEEDENTETGLMVSCEAKEGLTAQETSKLIRQALAEAIKELRERKAKDGDPDPDTKVKHHSWHTVRGIIKEDVKEELKANFDPRKYSFDESDMDSLMHAADRIRESIDRMDHIDVYLCGARQIDELNSKMFAPGVTHRIKGVMRPLTLDATQAKDAHMSLATKARAMLLALEQELREKELSRHVVAMKIATSHISDKGRYIINYGVPQPLSWEEFEELVRQCKNDECEPTWFVLADDLNDEMYSALTARKKEITWSECYDECCEVHKMQL